MATTPAPVTRAPRQKKANGAISKHTVTLSFEGKYAPLYDTFKAAAEADDRPLHVYLLRLLQQQVSNLPAE